MRGRHLHGAQRNRRAYLHAAAICAICAAPWTRPRDDWHASARARLAESATHPSCTKRMIAFDGIVVVKSSALGSSLSVAIYFSHFHHFQGLISTKISQGCFPDFIAPHKKLTSTPLSVKRGVSLSRFGGHWREICPIVFFYSLKAEAITMSSAFESCHCLRRQSLLCTWHPRPGLFGCKRLAVFSWSHRYLSSFELLSSQTHTHAR